MRTMNHKIQKRIVKGKQWSVDEEQEESDEKAGLDDNEARNDALGPEDGQEEDDEFDSLGFANL